MSVIDLMAQGAKRALDDFGLSLRGVDGLFSATSQREGNPYETPFKPFLPASAYSLARAFDSAQVVYNMLNQSAAAGLPTNYPAQDYGRLFDHTRAAGVVVVGIRVLAGGALSGSAARIRLRV